MIYDMSGIEAPTGETRVAVQRLEPTAQSCARGASSRPPTAPNMPPASSSPLASSLSGARAALPMPTKLAAVLTAEALADWSPADARDAAEWLVLWAGRQERGG
jgi:hypothetical protein